MTTQESFKRRVRARMSKTGERYTAARRSLIAHAQQPAEPAAWVADPDTTDEAIRTNTGHGWDEWVTLIDAGPGRDAGHTAIATWVREEKGVDGWWAQGVTVGYERITGLRLPGQMKDGTFTISRSRAVELDRDALRSMLLDDGDRASLVPGLTTSLASRANAKSLRFAVRDGDSELGTILVSMDLAGAKTRVTVAHSKLASPADGEHWKAFWSDWLADLGSATAE